MCWIPCCQVIFYKWNCLLQSALNRKGRRMVHDFLAPVVAGFT